MTLLAGSSVGSERGFNGCRAVVRHQIRDFLHLVRGRAPLGSAVAAGGKCYSGPTGAFFETIDALTVLPANLKLLSEIHHEVTPNTGTSLNDAARRADVVWVTPRLGRLKPRYGRVQSRAHFSAGVEGSGDLSWRLNSPIHTSTCKVRTHKGGNNEHELNEHSEADHRDRQSGRVHPYWDSRSNLNH